MSHRFDTNTTYRTTRCSTGRLALDCLSNSSSTFLDTQQEPCSFHASYHVVQEPTKSNVMIHMKWRAGRSRPLPKLTTSLSLHKIQLRADDGNRVSWKGPVRHTVVYCGRCADINVRLISRKVRRPSELQSSLKVGSVISRRPNMKTNLPKAVSLPP